MDWFTGIAQAGASALSGGILGLAGGFLSRLFDWLAVREKTKADREKYSHEREILKMETDRDVVIAKEQAMTARETAAADAEARKEVAAAELQAKSYEADRATYLLPEMSKDLPGWARGLISAAMAVVDLIRGLTRPGLTLYLCVLTTMIYIQVQAIIVASGGQPVSKEMAYTLIKQIIDTILFLTTTAVCWWFAARAKSQEK